MATRSRKDVLSSAAARQPLPSFIEEHDFDDASEEDIPTTSRASSSPDAVEKRRTQKKMSARKSRAKEKKNLRNLKKTHDSLLREKRGMQDQVTKLKANVMYFQSIRNTLMPTSPRPPPPSHPLPPPPPLPPQSLQSNQEVDQIADDPDVIEIVDDDDMTGHLAQSYSGGHNASSTLATFQLGLLADPPHHEVPFHTEINDNISPGGTPHTHYIHPGTPNFLATPSTLAGVFLDKPLGSGAQASPIFVPGDSMSSVVESVTPNKYVTSSMPSAGPPAAMPTSPVASPMSDLAAFVSVASPQSDVSAPLLSNAEGFDSNITAGHHHGDYLDDLDIGRWLDLMTPGKDHDHNSFWTLDGDMLDIQARATIPQEETAEDPEDLTSLREVSTPMPNYAISLGRLPSFQHAGNGEVPLQNRLEKNAMYPGGPPSFQNEGAVPFQGTVFMT